jgi:hypothetical protein
MHWSWEYHMDDKRNITTIFEPIAKAQNHLIIRLSRASSRSTDSAITSNQPALI